MDELNWPLMKDNIPLEDLDKVARFFQEVPMLTQSTQVLSFEEEWSDWLGTGYSVFVNSGSSANLLTMFALRELLGTGEIIVPTLTWASDITSVLLAGFEPIFVDINPDTLGMDSDQVLQKITSETRAVFITHILGYNALEEKLVAALEERDVLLIEDVCESHGATFQGRKLGTFGFASNFSFYYAHHMSTIEGGMICTDDRDLWQILRMLRSHGMVREATSDELKESYHGQFPDLNPDFIFAFPAFNVRSTEINAVIGRSQLKRLDDNVEIRQENLRLFLEGLDPQKYFVEFATRGNSNYAFTLVLREADEGLRDGIERILRQYRVEFRRGTSGGGNQLRQPYLRRLFGEEFRKYPKVDHVHFFGYYIGNYPGLPRENIHSLCQILNSL